MNAAELLLAQVDPNERARIVQAGYDLRQLQGIWKTKSETLGGKPVIGFNINKMKVEDRVAEVESGGGQAFGLLTLKPFSTPPTFDIRARDDDVTYECTGSYQVDGQVLTLTLANSSVVTLEKQKDGVFGK
jgi:uncharacterized protein involved in exopolysaccharide biosynthesis